MNQYFLFIVVLILLVLKLGLSNILRLCQEAWDSIRSIMDSECQHYQRNCKFVAPCCGKVYACRFCHDDNEEHSMNRFEVIELVCSECQTRQRLQTACESCSVVFGKYACLKCRIFDDRDKGQYHCEGCGLCRVGGKNNFFHCETCNFCLPASIINTHRCLENASQSDCPVCLEDLHTSRDPCQVFKCGHLMHSACHSQLLKAHFYTCPLCAGPFQ
ncbi:RING finger and CHY zinc finger domain-containing protein 1-like [Hetaerina americana]|uniref:RING finger and CHY zinc finger domain-containing protein 1-like n=1 Tax=Hetaerina americana TaxID=62018 RepID=UPI003A7F150F